MSLNSSQDTDPDDSLSLSESNPPSFQTTDASSIAQTSLDLKGSKEPSSENKVRFKLNSTKADLKQEQDHTSISAGQTKIVIRKGNLKNVHPSSGSALPPIRTNGTPPDMTLTSRSNDHEIGRNANKRPSRIAIRQVMFEKIKTIPLLQPYLKKWKDSDFFECAKAWTIVPFSSGEVVIQQGDEATFICILLNGACEVLVKERRVAVLEAGSLMGDVAFIKGGVRTATVKTIEPCTVAMIEICDLESMDECALYKVMYMFVNEGWKKINSNIQMDESAKKQDKQDKQYIKTLERIREYREKQQIEEKNQTDVRVQKHKQVVARNNALLSDHNHLKKQHQVVLDKLNKTIVERDELEAKNKVLQQRVLSFDVETKEKLKQVQDRLDQSESKSTDYKMQLDQLNGTISNLEKQLKSSLDKLTISDTLNESLKASLHYYQSNESKLVQKQHNR